jgi:hypothetical protein
MNSKKGQNVSTCASDLKIFQVLDILPGSQSLREPHNALPPEVSMSNYEIQLHIQIRPTDDEVTEEAHQDGDGRFRAVVCLGPRLRVLMRVSRPYWGSIIRPFARRYRVISVKCRVRKPVMEWGR